MRCNPWSKQELEWLDVHYPSIFPQELEEVLGKNLPGRTPDACYEMAKRRGLKKRDLTVISPRVYSSDVEGGYISGLTDGEGHFRASMMKTPGGNTTCRTEFKIDLRADDKGVLEWMQSYFGCGSISTPNRSEGNPLSNFSISSLFDVLQSVVPHFDTYPLRAKKLKDYIIWRKIVFALADRYMQPLTEKETAWFKKFCAKLSEGRKYAT